MTAVARIELVTTIDATAGREGDLRRLMASVAQFLADRPHIAIRHRLLVQRCDDPAAYALQIGAPEWMSVGATAGQVSLSAARNILLAPLLADEALDEAALVAFPDDDAWYADGTLAHIVDRFDADPALDLWFCRYNSRPVSVPEAEIRPSLQTAISYASSNTIVLRGALLRGIGGFDEGLGLGTPARSGEDTDFAMRAYLAAREVQFAPAALIGHRDFDPAIRARYYAGSLAAIAKHARRSPAAVVALARKLAVGGALWGRRELTGAQLADALRLTFGGSRPSA